MKSNAARLSVTAFFLLLSATLTGLASAAPSAPPEILQKIDSARSRADHEPLVSYYVKQAKDVRGMAALHRDMAEAYGRRAPSHRGSADLVAHCNETAESYEKIGADYDAIAAEHRRIAQQAQP